MNKTNILIFEGVDGSGKSHISEAMSDIWDVPLFKASDDNVFGNPAKKDFFVNDLVYGETKLAEFIEQTSPLFLIRDRSFYSEFVYSTVFQRKTDAEVVFKLDEVYSGKFQTLVVICTKDNYDGLQDHEMIIKHHPKIDSCYKELATSKLFSTPRFLLNTTSQNLYDQISKISSEFERVFGDSFLEA